MNISRTDTANLASTIPTPLIFNLVQDILLYIFELNTHRDVETEHCWLDNDPKPFCPLNIARHTSQVCCRWRQIMLKSPYIWGNIIDMTFFEGASESWAETVLERSRTAPLEIYGRVGWPEGRNRGFLKTLLIEQWHRVRGIELLVHNLDEGDYIDSEMWDVFFKRSAPALEKFIIKGAHDATTDSANDRGPFFANSAPCLRRFHCKFVEVVDYNTAWITKLKSLTLAHSFNTLEILNMLCTTLSLESLIIEDDTRLSDIPALANWCKKIYLPVLRRLEIRASEADLSDIYLSSIVGHPLCSLVFSTETHVKNVSPIRINSLLDNLVSYLKAFVVNLQPTMLYITIEPLCIIAVPPRNGRMARIYFAHPHLSITFGHWINPLQQMNLECGTIHSRLVSTLLSIPLKCCTNLTFLTDISSSTPQDDADFIRLTNAFSSVKSLMVRQQTLKLLTDTRLGSSVVFPLLDTLQLSDEPSGPSHSFSQELIFFLNYRKAAGVMISTIELDHNDEMENDIDWSFLDVIAGLKVTSNKISGDGVYICGSGDSSKLLWRVDYD